MTKKQLIETIRRVIKETLEEANAPAPSKPKETPGPAVAPGKPSTGKPKPRRPLGNPNVKPEPKATMTEAEMLAKIIKKYRAAKKTNEAQYQFQSPELQVPDQMSLSQFEPKPLKPGEIEITQELIDLFKKENPGNDSVEDFKVWIKANKNS